MKDVKHAYFTESGKKVGDTKASDATLTLSHNTDTTAANFVKHIEYLEDSVVDSNKSTILYEEVWGSVTTRNEANSTDVVNKYGDPDGNNYGDGSAKTALVENNAPSLKGSTLYVDTNAKMGFYVHKDVKSVLIQKNDGKSTTTFGTGTADLEDMLEDLNYKSGTYLFKISAILVDGRATVVVIHDWNEGDAGQGDKDRDPADNTGKVEIYVNFYDDVENKTGTYDEEIIYKAASSTGRLTLTAADLAEKLPAGKVVDTDVTKLPLTLEVKGENGGYAEADIQVTDAPATTRNVKLPVGYKISYGTTPTEVTFDTTTAASGVDVPNDAAITVTVPDSVDAWYVADPTVTTLDRADDSHFKTAGGTFTIAADAADVDHTTALGKKYAKLTLTQAVAGWNTLTETTNYPTGITGVEASFAGGGQVYFLEKDDTATVTVNFTATGTATADTSGKTVAKVNSETGLTSTTFTNATGGALYDGTGTATQVLANTSDTLKVADTAAKDITVTYTAEAG